MQAPIYDLERLREVLLAAPEAASTRAMAIVGSIAIFLVILVLVRHRKLREEYTPIWLVMAVGTVVISVWNDLLRAITRAVGAWAPSSTIFFMGELFLVTICLHYAVRLSSLGRQVKNLAQEVAMLREESGRHRRTPD